MKKLLSIVCGVLLSIVTTTAGTSKLTVSVSPSKAGEVAASMSNSSNNVKWGPTASAEKSRLLSTPTLYAFARNITESGYAFSHWQEGESIKSTNTTYSASGEHTIVAVFKPIIEVSPTSVGLVVYNNIVNPISLSITVNDNAKAKILYATLSDPDNFRINWDSKDVSNIPTHSLQVSYVGDINEAVGKTAQLTLRTDHTSNKDVVVTITVSDPPIVHYLGTKEEGDATARGRYTVVFDNGDSPLTIDANTVDKAVLYGTENDVTLTAQETNPDYKFFGWKRITKDSEGNTTNVEYISKDNPFSGNLNLDNARYVQAEFIPVETALFVVQGAAEQYYDLQEALNKAANASSKMVVFTGTNKNEVLYPRMDNDQYVIPSGVTLLIPFDEQYKSKIPNNIEPEKNFRELSQGNNGEILPYFENFSKLILEENVKMKIESGGKLCVAADLSATMPYNGAIAKHAWVEMRNGSLITVEGGANLYAWGYITAYDKNKEEGQKDYIDASNLDDVGSIVAKPGAIISESFQITDWRGGDASSNMVNNDNRVFPINQYYIQNIEVPLTLKSGAYERVYSAVDVTLLGIQTTGVDLISPKPTNTFFHLETENTYVQKYYSAENDQQNWLISTSGANPGKASLGSISIKMQVSLLGSINLVSSEYVLPITSNMNVRIENTDISAPYEYALLAGSSVSVDEKSTLTIGENASFFIYDSEQNIHDITGEGIGSRQGYFGSDESPMEPVRNRPNGRKNRTISDAKLVMDGKLIVEDGGVYTTNGKAIVTSSVSSLDHKPEIMFKTLPEKTETYQAIQGGSSNKELTYLSIPITSAYLYNKGYDSPANYTPTNAINANSENPVSFYYKAETADKGKWIVPGEVRSSDYNPKTITMPNKPYEIVVECSTNLLGDMAKNAFEGELVGEGFAFKNGTYSESVQFDDSKKCLKILLTYTPTNEHATRSATLTLTNEENEEFPIELSIKQNYEPDFTLTANPSTLYAEVGQTKASQVSITWADNNVTQLTETAPSSITWVYKIEPAVDGFVIDNSNVVNGKSFSVDYTAIGEGSVMANVSVTASYAGQSTTKTVEITGTVLTENTLAFDSEFSEIFVDDQKKELSFVQNSASPLSVTLDGTNASNYATLECIDGVWYISAKVEEGEVTIVASQQDDFTNNIAGKTIRKTIRIVKHTPEVTWNWSNVYAGQSYHTPLTGIPAGAVKTLIKSTDENNVLDFDPSNYSLQVFNVGSTQQASFTFEAEATPTHYAVEPITYDVQINPDPRFLPLQLNNGEKYRIVASDIIGSVETQEKSADLYITLPASASITLNFIGIPGYMAATIKGEGLKVEEGVDYAEWNEISLDEGKWTFSELNKRINCVRLTNTSENAITINGLMITLRESYTHYYGKADAVASVGGRVAAEGYYMALVTDGQDLINNRSNYSTQAIAYSAFDESFQLTLKNLPFKLYAQSDPGYYFVDWTSVGKTLSSLDDKDLQNPALITYFSASLLQRGYGFTEYQAMFCSEGACDGMSDEEKLQGIFSLIPCTHVGTWQANFDIASVNSGNDVDFGVIQSPNADNVTEVAEFIVMADDVNDFKEPVITGDGFSINPGSLNVALGKYTLSIKYTPQNIAGVHSGTLTLQRIDMDGQEPSMVTIQLRAEENLTPDFQISSPVSFGSGNLGQSTIELVEPNNLNQVANLYATTWSAEIFADELGTMPSDEFSLRAFNARTGAAEIKYLRKYPGDREAYLHLTATYVDAAPVAYSKKVICKLIGHSTNVKTANPLAFKDNMVVYVDGDAFDPFKNRNFDNTGAITFELPSGGLMDAGDGRLQPTGESGRYLVKASQSATDQFHASELIETIIEVRKHATEVTWNWDVLYFGGTYDNPITTNNKYGLWSLELLDNASGMISYNVGARTATVATAAMGEYTATFRFSQEASDTHEAYEQIIYTTTMISDPRHVRVDVNTQRTYDAVTIKHGTGNLVSYNVADQSIIFQDHSPSLSSDRQWTMHFMGVPDELSFKASGDNAWSIEESSNGQNDWTPIYSSALITTPGDEAFSIPLSPSSQYIRITYGSNSKNPSDGKLSELFVSALERVKCDVSALYMPISANVVNNPTEKTINFTYISAEELTVSTSDNLFIPNITVLPPTANADTYYSIPVTITSKATMAKDGVSLFVKNAAGDILLELPIESYVFPQTLPIRLATDPAKRFYFVTTNTEYVEWQAPVLVMKNAPANKPRYVTFEFTGSPSVIRFAHTAGNKGTWIIEERAAGESWTKADVNSFTYDSSTGEIEQGLRQTSSQVRITYQSAYAEAIEIHDLIIVGDATLTPNETTLHFSDATDAEKTRTLVVTTVNLPDFRTEIDNANFSIVSMDKSQLETNTIADAEITITWTPNAVVEYGTLTFKHPTEDKVLATVQLVGTRKDIDGPTTNIHTGIGDGYKISGFDGSSNREVLLTDAFDRNDNPMFDYLFIFGETTTMDGSKTVSAPNNQAGSNAKTPCFIYQKSGNGYSLLKMVENANDKSRIWETGAISINEDAKLSVYITGFCPYASTGYTKYDEGVFHFKGKQNSTLDVYLQDAYIYSRYKTIDGHSFIGRDNGESFTEGYVCGSGAVLVFECTSVSNSAKPFNVNIHTKDENLLKSHYGCFFASAVGRAFQVSSPVQVRLSSADLTPATTLTFDDRWPLDITDATDVLRTNGFVSLQKQVNNAPSIDLGNPNTVVIFDGGQVELQNAQIVSDNYKTTMAISYRSGYMSTFKMALGIGTDSHEGTVYFKDGTTTVDRMYVKEQYRQYYLMDQDNPATAENESDYTSCIRCPANTYVSGGSHSMLRACTSPTSKGGAPKSAPTGVSLGLYKYPYVPEQGHKGGWTGPDSYGLVKPTQAPDGYKFESVTPNDNGTPDKSDDFLNFWVPAGYDTNAAEPEVDQTISYWKACMTRIAAEYAGSGGSAGGDQTIEMQDGKQTELVYNLMYCKIDQKIFDVIADPSYSAPIKNPATSEYMSIPPSEIGETQESYMTNEEPYVVENKIYYVLPIECADTWMTFAAPFDVEKIYVMETYSENALREMSAQGDLSYRETILNAQARQNAHFASFFAVTIALGSDKPFNDIYNGYMEWAQSVDRSSGLYIPASGETYDLRGKRDIVNYNGKNWREANYYLYRNNPTNNWIVTTSSEELKYQTQWEFVQAPEPGDPLLCKGDVCSLMFPYGSSKPESERDDIWDYWSGKLLVFESTTGKHEVDGSNYFSQSNIMSQDVDEGEAILLGNTTFAALNVPKENTFLYEYSPGIGVAAGFLPTDEDKDITPTTAFLLANPPKSPSGMPAKCISREGRIIYDESGNGNQNGTSGGRIPTVGGGNDLFVTSIAGGINVAVAAPQNVRVLSSTGAVIYSGYVTTAVDIQLPTTGIYIVSGENEVQKILF